MTDKNLQRMKFILVPMITVMSFIRFLIVGQWPEATIVICGFVWIAWDAYSATLQAKQDEHSLEDVKKLTDRVSKIELKTAFNPQNLQIKK